MEDMKVTDFIDQVSQRTATPGAGASVAVTSSMAVSVILMAIRFSQSVVMTEKNKKMLEKTIDELEVIQNQFVQYVREDEEGFIVLSKAYKMPATTPAERKEKERHVQQGLVTASEVPMKLIHDIRRVQILVEKVYPLIKQNIVADIAVGLSLLQSSAHSCAYNVYSNVRFLKNKPKKLKMTTTIETRLNSIDKLNKLMLKSIKSIIKH